MKKIINTKKRNQDVLGTQHTDVKIGIFKKFLNQEVENGREVNASVALNNYMKVDKAEPEKKKKNM